jgi:hypothetical protein
MGAAMFISMGVAIMLCIPIIAFFLAKRVGRRPWLWFCISLVLPVIATLILFILPDLTEVPEPEETVHN